MDGLVNLYETDFCVAVIPIQVVMLIYYAMGRRLPLREVRSFFLLMLVNLLSMVFSLVAAYFNGHVRFYPLWLVYLVDILYTCFTLTRPYMLFWYMADVSALDGREGRAVRAGATVLYAAAELITVTTPFTGWLFQAYQLFGVFRGPLYRFLPAYYGLFLIFSAALVLSRRRAGHTKATTFLAAIVLMAIGTYWKYIIGYGHVLVMGYFTTMALFILFLARRNPDLYTDDQTGLLNKDALFLVLKDHLAHYHGHVAGLGIILKEFEAMRTLYGSGFVDDFLADVKRYVLTDFPHAYGFYLNGGRLFLLLKNQADVGPYMEKFHARFDRPWKGQSFYFGAACCGIPGDIAFSGPDEMLHSLDMGLASAEAAHGADVLVDAAYQEKVRRDIHVQRLLSKAVETKGVDMFLQPVVNAKTGVIEGAEALARLRDDDGRPISPAEFIPAAESTGAIHSLGLQMVEKACAFIEDGSLNRCGMQWINVNVSPVQCLEGDLAEKIDRIRESYAVPLSRVRLEITEQSTLSTRGLSQVERLHHIGYGLALDDFGSGYSNSSRLRKLPLIEVKLDMCLVRNHFKHPDSYLESAVKVFHDMGLSVVAEGVEYQSWADELAAMGVDYLQGYLYAKPLPVEEFIGKYGQQG